MAASLSPILDRQRRISSTRHVMTVMDRHADLLFLPQNVRHACQTGDVAAAVAAFRSVHGDVGVGVGVGEGVGVGAVPLPTELKRLMSDAAAVLGEIYEEIVEQIALGWVEAEGGRGWGWGRGKGRGRGRGREGEGVTGHEHNTRWMTVEEIRRAWRDAEEIRHALSMPVTRMMDQVRTMPTLTLTW